MEPQTGLSASEPNQRLERLLEVTRSLSVSLNLETFLDALISAAAELTGCEVASILELDEDGEQLHFVALPWFHRELLKMVKVPLETSLAGWVFQNSRPVIVPDITIETRHFKGADQAAKFVTRSLMAVPIMLSWGDARRAGSG